MNPPSDYTPFAAAAWQRMRARLTALGLWQPLDEILLDVASRQVGMYAQMADVGVPPSDLTAIRATARELMGEMLWIEPRRAIVGALNQQGYDAEVLALAKPFAISNVSPKDQ